VVVKAKRVRPAPVCGLLRAAAPSACRQVNRNRRSRRCSRCWVRCSGQRGSTPRIRLSSIGLATLWRRKGPGSWNRRRRSCWVPSCTASCVRNVKGCGSAGGSRNSRRPRQFGSGRR
jgi:hypothetical protein